MYISLSITCHTLSKPVSTNASPPLLSTQMSSPLTVIPLMFCSSEPPRDVSSNLSPTKLMVNLKRRWLRTCKYFHSMWQSTISLWRRARMGPALSFSVITKWNQFPCNVATVAAFDRVVSALVSRTLIVPGIFWRENVPYIGEVIKIRVPFCKTLPLEDTTDALAPQ